MQRVLALWLPNWPVQRLVSSRPELRGRPVVLEAPLRRGRCVAACSPEAFAAGVRLGMPSAEAATLLTKSLPLPSLGRAAGPRAQEALWAYDPAADRAALEQLAQRCHCFSPTTGIEPSDAPETILLDATNLAPLYGSEGQFVDQAVRGLRREGFAVRAALASTLGAAWALAHFAAAAGERCIVSPDQTHAALAPLPTAALRLDDDLRQTLAGLGVERVGEALALPRDPLRSRFGPRLLLRIDQALGTAGEVFAAVEPAEAIVAEHLLEYPQSRRDALETVVDQLLARLAAALASRSAGALQVACRFECEGAPPVEAAIGLFQPTANPRHLREILGLELERLRLRGPATAISLRVVRQAPLGERQGVLFDEPRDLENSRRLAGLVDRLAGRLGREAVVRCRLVREAQPELGYVEEPLVDGACGAPAARRRAASPGGRSEPAERGPLDRPLHLLRRPAPLEVVAVAPDGPPIQFRRGGRRHVITRQWGPERIETGWWRRQSIGRDYYRVETTAGERYWLYRRRRDGRWFLHGAFG